MQVLLYMKCPFLMQVSAWNVRHAAMQGFLRFMRASDAEFHTILPAAIYDQGEVSWVL